MSATAEAIDRFVTWLRANAQDPYAPRLTDAQIKEMVQREVAGRDRMLFHIRWLQHPATPYMRWIVNAKRTQNTH